MLFPGHDWQPAAFGPSPDRGPGHSTIRCIKALRARIALLQYLRTLLDHGDQLAQDSLKKNPAKMITLINACCNMATTGIAIDKFKRRNEIAADAPGIVASALTSETSASETKPS